MSLPLGSHSESTGHIGVSQQDCSLITKMLQAGLCEALVSDPFCGHPLFSSYHRAAAMKCMLVKGSIGVHGVEHESVSHARLVLDRQKTIIRPLKVALNNTTPQ